MDTDEWARRWAVQGLRAVLDGLAVIGLSIVNVPLLLLTMVSLVLTPVPLVGVAAVQAVTALVRKRTDLHRRLSARAGVPIRRPYRPMPPRTLPGGWARFRWIVTDPATWRDVAWLLPGAIVGIGLGVISLALPLYGMEGLTLVPLWLYLGTDWYGYGLFWPIESIGEGWLSAPQGLVFLTVGLALAPRLRWVDALFARLFLAPTTAALLRLRVSHLFETRADTVDAQAAELRRIERDLHDGAQARLVSLGMTIGLAEEMVERDPDAARKLLAEARDASTLALLELRNLVRGIHPPVLAERGLDGAVRALALSLPVPTAVTSNLYERAETPVEAAAYFAVAEALANVVRHSGARNAWVTLRHENGTLGMTVTDDGIGSADPRGGTGLRGIERRLAAFDGTMTLSSPPGGPTVVTMELPCVLSSPKILPSFGTG